MYVFQTFVNLKEIENVGFGHRYQPLHLRKQGFTSGRNTAGNALAVF